MGNMITIDTSGDLEPLHMSNGLTSVFIAVCVLSASALASTDQEKLFAVWLASHDQAVRGSGAVGFDISDLPWTAHGFEAEQAFLLKVIRSAQSQEYWHLLGYQPRADWVIQSLEHFRLLIVHFSKEALVPERARSWSCEVPSSFVTCPRHGVYLHQEGCVICNDES
jgi:hypothetical protein